MELALWGFLTIFIASQVVDLLLTGKPFAKVVHVVTREGRAIWEHIISDPGRTATILSVQGLCSGEQKNLLMVWWLPARFHGCAILYTGMTVMRL